MNFTIAKGIEKMLAEASQPGSDNILFLDNVKSWLKEYLELHELEMDRFPELRDLQHWDLLMADFDASCDALFVVAVFSESSVSFYAGRGNMQSVRTFAESEFPENTNEIASELYKRFDMISDTVVVPNKDLYLWIAS